jgi:alpha-beta hydrolase superfamily lysophospholipase
VRRAAIVMAHGVMSHAGWLRPLGEHLAGHGIDAVAVDRAGSGQARERPGRCDPEVWVGDLVAAVEALRAAHDRVALLGWCWGARSAIVAASRSPVERLVLAAPGLAMAGHVRARAAELAAMSADPLPLPFGIDEFSEDPAVIARIRGDGAAWSSQPRAFLAPSRALLEAALMALPRLQTPRTTVLAEGDRIVDNTAVARLLGGSPITLPGGHALVLESPARVASEIAAAVLS